MRPRTELALILLAAAALGAEVLAVWFLLPMPDPWWPPLVILGVCALGFVGGAATVTAVVATNRTPGRNPHGGGAMMSERVRRVLAIGYVTVCGSLVLGVRTLAERLHWSTDTTTVVAFAAGWSVCAVWLTGHEVHRALEANAARREAKARAAGPVDAP